MIPRSIAFKAWAACLGSQARRLRRLATDEAARDAGSMHGVPAIAGVERKSAGRLEEADRLARHADAISGWIGDRGHRGADVDPALHALVTCYLFRHGPSLAGLRRWADERGYPGWLDHCDPADVPRFIERLLEVR
jgi:hypothetical protein